MKTFHYMLSDEQLIFLLRICVTESSLTLKRLGGGGRGAGGAIITEAHDLHTSSTQATKSHGRGGGGITDR